MLYHQAPATPGALEILVRQVIDEVIGIEGGYVNDPKDAGGATRWGITEKTARALGYKGDMRDLPRSTAVWMYREQYFVKPNFDEVAKYSPRIAAELFEQEVNLPPGRAASFMQRALNALNNEASFYNDLKPDGDIGDVTISALSAYLDHRKKEGEAVLLSLLNAQQALYYMERAEKRPANERFFYGWVKNRTMAV